MILITGATGHLGNTLIHDLMKTGADLRLFLQPNEPVVALDGVKFDLVVGDIRDEEAVDRAVSGCDYVYHLAGVIDISPKDHELLEGVNVLGTRNVVNACLKHKVRRLVYVSSVHAIPEPPMHIAIKEPEREAFPDKTLLGPYAISKSKATHEVYLGVERGLDAVLLFPSGIIGPGDFRGSEMGKVLNYLLKKNNNSIYACFKGQYNFVDVRDVARALQLAMDKGNPGQGYLIPGHTITIADLFRYVARWTGRSTIKLILFPVGLVKAAARVVARFARLFKKKPFFTPYSISVLESNSEMDASKAEKELGYKPRPLEDTLNSTLNWITKRSAQVKRSLTKRKLKKSQRGHNKPTSTATPS